MPLRRRRPPELRSTRAANHGGLRLHRNSEYPLREITAREIACDGREGGGRVSDRRASSARAPRSHVAAERGCNARELLGNGPQLHERGERDVVASFAIDDVFGEYDAAAAQPWLPPSAGARAVSFLTQATTSAWQPPG